ncbi:hypothetical protein PIB30_047806 [Stylosanthes scabra]|uniref:GDSL esterase/lipase n=1 Tax=Stylosanthes scabra TaxID=79078 RepID=A0ABU6XEI9_9FABA|nr:hypothetical protein [Stylosanthes scabra]
MEQTLQHLDPPLELPTQLNDLAGIYSLNTTFDQLKANVPDVLAQFKTIIKYVYNQGGRSFWIHNTGPVGCLPYVKDLPNVKDPPVDKAACKIPYNELFKFYNRGLKDTVAQLRKELPLAAITYVDVYSLKYSLFSQPKKHGKNSSSDELAYEEQTYPSFEDQWQRGDWKTMQESIGSDYLGWCSLH